MLAALADEPVLLVFAVIGVAAAIGALPVRGVALGPAAALFVGLAVSAIDESVSDAPGLTLLRELGLVVFTYTIGVATGPAFFASLRRHGAAAVATTAGLVVGLAGICALAASLLDLRDADRAGLFAGATTNTPALQAATDAAVDGNPVVAYSITYPAAVAAMIVVVTLLLGRRLPLPAVLEPPDPEPRAETLVSWTVEVTAADLPVLGELNRRYPRLRFSRVEQDGQVTLAVDSTQLRPGDAVAVVGPEPAVAAFAADVGRRADRHLPEDRSVLDFRRILVSNRRLAGTRLGDLDLVRRFGVTVTRVRRGDEDLVADDDFVLALGDRVRVVGPTQALGPVARVFGDSERLLADVDISGLALGIAAGLLLGEVEVPVAGADFALGAGGGPLVAGLVLGYLSRTGPITWQLPHGANLVVRQIGLVMFLACAGLASGSAFSSAIGTSRGAQLAAAGTVIAALFAGAVALAAQVVLRRNVIDAAGIVAGVETQPAALAYAAGRTGGDSRVPEAYALVFPAAMIAKILVVQFLV